MSAIVKEKSPDALKTIGEVADALGVAPHVLRFWESKFRQIKPQKRRGRRYYRPEDVALVEEIKSLLYTQGYTLKGAQKYLAGKARGEVTAANSNEATATPASAAEAPEALPKVLIRKIFVPAEKKPSKPQSRPSQEHALAGQTDLFGAPVIQPSAAEEQPEEVLETLELVEEVPGAILTDAELEQLRNVYRGLCATRDRLQKVVE